MRAMRNCIEPMKSIASLLVSAALLSTALAQSPASSDAPPRPAGVVVFKDLAYVPGGHERQKLDLYVPAEGEGPFPLIVWIHGGAWQYGGKEGCIPLPWALKGYVVASINYRLSQDAKFPAQIEDCKAAVRWLRGHAKDYKIDRDLVIAWGDSAGGHLASLLGTAGDDVEWELGPPAESSRVQAVIDWYGRADLTRVCMDPAMAEHAVAHLIGGSGPGVYHLAWKASPIAHVSKDDPPFLIMHGDGDGTVPLQQSEAFAEALKTANVPVMMVVLKGVGHGGEEFLKPDKIRIVDIFLKNYLSRQKRAKAK
jgi:acetyl esterase/lipase